MATQEVYKGSKCDHGNNITNASAKVATMNLKAECVSLAYLLLSMEKKYGEEFDMQL